MIKTGVEANIAGSNPFPGLQPFDVAQQHVFFGRETQVDSLLRHLRTRRFLAIVGSSASGKSSLVRAGMLPALNGGYLAGAGSRWRIAVMRPGLAPVAALASALATPGVLGEEADDAGLERMSMQHVLERGELGLIDLVFQAQLAADENLLVLVDQFEELFRFTRGSSRAGSSDEASAFVKLLLAAAAWTELPIYVALTMRSDFLGDCAQFRDLTETMNDGLFLVPRMTRNQLQHAIEGPVHVARGEIAPRLVARLLNDVGADADQLPVLQHALMRTWDYWSADHTPGEPLDVRHYTAIGEMSGALSKHADAIYTMLDPALQLVAERLFTCVTDRGSDTRGIRLPTAFEAVCRIAGASHDEVATVVVAFNAPGRSFLTPAQQGPFDGTVLDISHESLMRIWTRLSEWVDAEAKSAQTYRRLIDDAARGAALWRDPDLAVGLAWYAKNEHRINAAWAARHDPGFERALETTIGATDAAPAEAGSSDDGRRRGLETDRFAQALAFLTNSAEEPRKAAEREEADRLAELEREDAARRAALSARRKQIIVSTTIVSAAIILALLASSIFYTKQVAALQLEASHLNMSRSESQRQAHLVNDELRFEEEAFYARQISAEEDNARGLALALVAAGDSLATLGKIPPLIQRTLHELLKPPIETRILDEHPNGDAGINALTTCGRFVASALSDGTIRVHDLGGMPIVTYSVASELGGNAGSKDPVTTLAFDRECAHLASGGNTVALVMDVAHDKKQLARLVPPDNVRAVSFSPDGRFVLIGGSGGMRLWDWSNSAMGEPFGPSHQPASICRQLGVEQVATLGGNADGWTFATAANCSVQLWSVSGTAHVTKDWDWDLSQNGVVTSLTGLTPTDFFYTYHGSLLKALRNAPRGQMLAYDDDVGQLNRFGSNTAAARPPLSKDWAFAQADAIAFRWAENPHALITVKLSRLKAAGSEVNSLAFDPTGRYLITGGAKDATLRFWDVREIKAPLPASTGSELALVKVACRRLLSHPVLLDGEASAATPGAIKTCGTYGWNASEAAHFAAEQRRAGAQGARYHR